MKIFFKAKPYCLIAVTLLGSTAATLVVADTVNEVEILENYRQQITEIESKIKLPESSHPLSSYSRFYSVYKANGHRKFVGEYRYDPAHAGIHMVKYKQLPKTMDGGCSVIQVEYDLEAKTLLRVNCGGKA